MDGHYCPDTAPAPARRVQPNRRPRALTPASALMLEKGRWPSATGQWRHSGSHETPPLSMVSGRVFVAVQWTCCDSTRRQGRQRVARRPLRRDLVPLQWGVTETGRWPVFHPPGRRARCRPRFFRTVQVRGIRRSKPRGKVAALSVLLREPVLPARCVSPDIAKGDMIKRLASQAAPEPQAGHTGRRVALRNAHPTPPT